MWVRGGSQLKGRGQERRKASNERQSEDGGKVSIKGDGVMGWTISAILKAEHGETVMGEEQVGDPETGVMVAEWSLG